MNLSKPTRELLSLLDDSLERKLAGSEDLGILIELSARHSLQPVLNELSFLAKFIFKTHGLLSTIGIHGVGYDRLSREFGEAVKKAILLVNTLLTLAPKEIKQHFESRYMELTPESFEALIALCQDLSRYKNWMIDHPGQDFV